MNALHKVGLPAGCFSLLHGKGNDIGMALVKHPLTQAVGFTGSLRGGRALMDIAASRPHPIPVYAEMGSINPVFLLPRAFEYRYPLRSRLRINHLLGTCLHALFKFLFHLGI